jgi:restriction endonuclease S subunit
MNVVRLGQVLQERKEPIGAQNGDELPLLGINNKKGLHLTTRQRPTDLRRYLRVEKNWFAYNPMRINVGSVGYASNESLCGLISPDYVVFSCNQEVYPPYLFMWLRSKVGLLEIRRNTAGSVRERLYFKSLVKVRMPLPLIEHQKEIYAIKQSIDYITNGYRNTIDNKIPSLRQGILQLAVMGKLVPQDFNDEPASILLEKIASEKKRLIAEGKIKKSKPLPPIKADEVPYDLPRGWEWTRIRYVTYDLGQKIPDAPFTYIDVSTIDEERGRISDSPQVLKPENAPSRARKLVAKGTVIYSTVRPYLMNIAIVDRDFVPKPIVSTAFAVLHPFSGLFNRFLYYYLRSQPFIDYVNAQMTGMAYPAINDMRMSIGPVPIPPLAEQKRIVAKVDELMALCAELESKLQQSFAAGEMLMEAVVAQVIAG